MRAFKPDPKLILACLIASLTLFQGCATGGYQQQQVDWSGMQYLSDKWSTPAPQSPTRTPSNEDYYVRPHNPCQQVMVMGTYGPYYQEVCR